MKYSRLTKLFLNTRGKRLAVLIAIDVLSFVIIDSLFATFSSIGAPSELAMWFNSLLHIALIFIFRAIFRIYSNVWRYANVKAYCMTLISDGIAGISTILVTSVLNRFHSGIYIGVWRALSVGALTAILMLMSRFCYSLLYKNTANSAYSAREPVVIIGAGRLGTHLVGDLEDNPNSVYTPKFFIDNDITKIGNRVMGLKVYDHNTAAPLIINEGIKTVIITITHREKQNMSELYERYSALGCKVKVCESLNLSEDDAIGKARLREFDIEDLLFRDAIEINSERTYEFYSGKTVLVTGGGGSIGSEICRQIARCKPERLIIFDIYENNAYDIQQELVRKFGQELNLTVEIGSVRDAKRVDLLFERYKPDIVFHAAAHKHVPLMESSAAEAIKNNCMGTYNTANAAEKHGAEKFILISTDKAVNPTNVMGASKRMCEMIVQSRSDSKTCFAAVRFGNILGSNGSVIPLFRRQIAEGGPVTITDKNIIRYFMTISEATQLVLESGAMAKRGELFVLDMGNPVRIYDLAVQMIKMSGYRPGVDIEIKEIGLRPGEKLYEELLIKTEGMMKTENNLIFIEIDKPFSREEIDEQLDGLISAATEACSPEQTNESARRAISRVVSSYKSNDEVNRTASESDEMKLVCNCR